MRMIQNSRKLAEWDKTLVMTRRRAMIKPMVIPMVVPRIVEVVMAEAEGSLGEGEMLTRARAMANPKGLTQVGAGIVGRLATGGINALSTSDSNPRAGDRNPKTQKMGMVWHPTLSLKQEKRETNKGLSR